MVRHKSKSNLSMTDTLSIDGLVFANIRRFLKREPTRTLYLIRRHSGLNKLEGGRINAKRKNEEQASTAVGALSSRAAPGAANRGIGRHSGGTRFGDIYSRTDRIPVTTSGEMRRAHEPLPSQSRTCDEWHDPAV
ncbi:unnamed protein product [Soboliphyme baturini]|uniref:Transposase n=1 Tax=Soboliphyme baturini TaxID=241478 RepID=A0A183ICF5_9BILA|nr:unnamed protein product [Soboliphyme baturini]